MHGKFRNASPIDGHIANDGLNFYSLNKKRFPVKNDSRRMWAVCIFSLFNFQEQMRTADVFTLITNLNFIWYTLITRLQTWGQKKTKKKTTRQRYMLITILMSANNTTTCMWIKDKRWHVIQLTDWHRFDATA